VEQPIRHTASVTVEFAPDGRPLAATARARIDRPAADVWRAIEDIERFVRFIPMVHSATKRGDHVAFDLKFRLGILLSVGFRFEARATYEAGRSMELRWISGEPRDVRLRFHVQPTDDGRACIVSGEGSFDMMSLGWLAKYFLKNHPEIELGVFPGVALVLVDALRKAVA
jgi:carbon monoxide dehydrogenase subunit G